MALSLGKLGDGTVFVFPLKSLDVVYAERQRNDEDLQSARGAPVIVRKRVYTHAH